VISDESGVLDMPFKIMVSVAVICALAPMLMSMAESAEEDAELEPALSEAEKLKAATVKVYYGGAGTMTTVDISLDPGMSLEVGGDDGLGYSIRVMKNGELAGRVYLDRPAVNVLEPASFSGRCSVRVDCVISGGSLGVTMSR